MFGEQAAIRARFISNRKPMPRGKPVSGEPQSDPPEKYDLILMHNISICIINIICILFVS